MRRHETDGPSPSSSSSPPLSSDTDTDSDSTAAMVHGLCATASSPAFTKFQPK